MADATKAHGGADHASIPPIEIGSFIAVRPDKSEFVGSASGVFFANTVFRAFAAANPPSTAQPAEATGVTDPGSAHSYVVAAENGPEEASEENSDDSTLGPDALGAISDAQASGTPSYGLTTTGLGIPPSPEAAKELLMLWFRNWHPFFPFLHGPSFLDQANKFYEKNSRESTNSSSRLALRSRTCWAVTFQCILNIAASPQQQPQLLNPSSRIQSVSALTNLLGIISGSRDISSLQALLAVELYLMTRMSLRAASTVHGVLTQTLYHSGFHRCPYRYIQLPPDMCVLRQRVFWSAYVLDRQISQALGHPSAIKDEEIDVCIPGMAELHHPIGPMEQSSTAQHVHEDDIHAHLPQVRQKRTRPGNEPSSTRHETPSGDSLDVQGSAHHHKTSPEGVGEYVLGYTVTYSKLLGAVLNLFHQSIHSRHITRDVVIDLTSRIHFWWNSLPAALQDDGGSETRSHYSAFFAVAYQYLLLLISRPFLSLPTHRTDFKSSLQSALCASRAIVRTLRASKENMMLLSWPGVLSATWTAGLVLAYASLLEIYPLEKAALEMTTCLGLLDSMAPTWPSARHCRTALTTFLDRLKQRFRGVQQNTQPTSAVRTNLDINIGFPSNSAVRPRYSPTVEGTSSNKRRRTNGTLEPNVQQQHHSHVPSFALGHDGHNISQAPTWQPVLQYKGPDFGFDSNQDASGGEWQGLIDQDIYTESGELFDLAGWDAYVQGVDDRLSF